MSHFGFIVALVNPIGGFWRILDYDQETEHFDQLIDQGFKLSTFSSYRRELEPGAIDKLKTFTEVKDQVRERKSELEWFSMTLERANILDTNFRFPPGSKYFHKNRSGIENVRRIDLMMKHKNITGD